MQQPTIRKHNPHHLWRQGKTKNSKNPTNHVTNSHTRYTNHSHLVRKQWTVNTYFSCGKLGHMDHNKLLGVKEVFGVELPLTTGFLILLFIKHIIEIITVHQFTTGKQMPELTPLIITVIIINVITIIEYKRDFDAYNNPNDTTLTTWHPLHSKRNDFSYRSVK